jgi:aryl-alcohol dehydrogenase-like predicted oxidoreductase
MQQKKNELPALLLHHCICQPFIDTVIVGINNINQLKNNLRPIKPDSVLPALQHNISSEILTPSLWPK